MRVAAFVCHTWTVWPTMADGLLTASIYFSFRAGHSLSFESFAWLGDRKHRWATRNAEIPGLLEQKLMKIQLLSDWERTKEDEEFHLVLNRQHDCPRVGNNVFYCCQLYYAPSGGRECNLESITRSGVSSFLRVERWSNVQLEIFISPSPASPLSLLINDVPASRFGEASPKGCVPRWGNMTAARRTYEGIIKANQDQTLTRKRSRTLDEYVLQCALPSASLRTTTIISHLCRSIPISSAISRPWLRAGRHVTLVLAHWRRKSFGGRPGGIFVWQWLSAKISAHPQLFLIFSDVVIIERDFRSIFNIPRYS